MSSDSILRGLRAIVTGAGKGIGKETALALAKSGADICVASRTEKEINDLVLQARSNNVNAVGVVTDVSKRTGAAKVVSEAKKKLGGVDAVVCVAGYPMIEGLWNRSIQELSVEDLLGVFKIDVIGSFLVVKEALPIMKEQRNGVVILFSSTPAIAGYEKGGAYAVSKAANLGLVKSIASEYGRFNVRAYGIAPGNIKTDRTFGHLSKRERKLLESEPPMKRWGRPEEVANVVVALVSNHMSFVTGQTVVVDGGTVML